MLVTDTDITYVQQISNLMLAHRDKVRFVRPLPKCKSKRFVSQVVLGTLPESQSFPPLLSRYRKPGSAA